MCLLMQINKDTPAFSDEFIKSVFNRNSDGLGIMWVDGDNLHYYKCLPQSLKEAIDTFRKYTEGRDCCAHWRMKTHGDIDLTNCHPYPVFGFEGGAQEEHDMPLLMMHNGVLSTGNSKDFSKSDTWHYIREFLAPIVKDNPEVIHTEAFQKMLAAHIGSSNKFALLDASGRTVIINRQAGVTYNNAWLSNTYAWDYYGLHPDAPKGNYYAGGNKHSGWYNSSYWAGKKWEAPTPKKADKKYPAPVKNPKKADKKYPAPVKNPKTHAGNVSELLDLLEQTSPNVAESVMWIDMSCALRENDYSDIIDLIDMISWGYVTEQQAVDALIKPQTLKGVVDAAAKVMQADDLKDEQQADVLQFDLGV